jgi:hypothetical protein
MTPHEPTVPATPEPPSQPDVPAAQASTTPRSKRKRPLHTLSLSPECWERLDEIARRWGIGRSAAVERMVRETTMPRDIAASPPTTRLAKRQ